MEGIIFKEILKNYLKDNGLTQTAFALEVGVKPSQVSEWLKGTAARAGKFLPIQL